ncbi:MAG: Holliday junction resolvase RuvX [Candidatus Orphnella occulta]|nr:Holliday junction resolvase RuvX [Candidatus Orphnella occulta]
MGRIVGLDLGTKRIGVAISDESQVISFAEETINVTSIKASLNYIVALVERYSADKVIIGLPLNMNGTKGPQAEKAIDFASRLQRRVKAGVLTFDERLTTSQGEQILIAADMSREKRKKHIDKLAAQIILQAYLDCSKNSK